jgi:magnesium-protoporphyrin IX monomethyl ester (oxidative) cyclase
VELDFDVEPLDKIKNENVPSGDDQNLQYKGPQTFIGTPLKVKKVLLLFPPAYTIKSARDINPLPPIGIGMLASILEKNNYQVGILDCLVRGWDQEEETQANKDIVRVGMTDDQIEEYIKEFKPDVVGVSCMFSVQHKVYPQIFAAIKSANANIITVAGGAHVTVCSKEVLEDPNCDYVITGESEESLVDFLEVLQGRKTFESVDGLGWVKENSDYVINPKVKWIEDLDSLPFPAYHLIGLEQYFGLESSHGIRHEKEYAPIVTSRGCPAKCTFCSANKMFGYKFRTRSAQNVLDELWFLKKTYGIKEIMFEDDNVTASRKHCTELFQKMIDQKIDLRWDTPNGVGMWTLTDDIIDLMKEAGCVKINFPIESGDQEILKNVIKKPLDLKRTKNLFKRCQDIGLDYGTFLVVGMPGEKIEDIWTSFKFCAEVGSYSPHVSVATPYPGTELYEQCKENDYFSRDYALDGLFISSFMLKTPDWSENDLRKVLLQGKLYLKFRQVVDRPSDAWYLVKQLVSQPRKIFSYLKRILQSGSVWRNPASSPQGSLKS